MFYLQKRLQSDNECKVGYYKWIDMMCGTKSEMEKELKSHKLNQPHYEWRVVQLTYTATLEVAAVPYPKEPQST